MYIRRSDLFAVVQSPAKVNLFLEVLARRDDGFHEIETLMAPINLFDTLEFTSTTDEQLRFTCNWVTGYTAQSNGLDDRLGRLPKPDDNIVYRVLQDFRQQTSTKNGATIRLRKRIPTAAGLGGASSNAAAALLAANHAWRIGWSQHQLANFSAEFGSDIPFFFVGGAAVCRGRGEVVEPVESRETLNLVVVRPPAGLSTAKVYQHCNVPQQPKSMHAMLDTIRKGNAALIVRGMTNRLQCAALHLSPWVSRIHEFFESLGCLGHQMSGSGTSYFGVCRNARHARCVASRVRAARLGFVYRVATYTNPIY